MTDKGLGVVVKTFRKMQLSFENILIDDHWVIVSEGFNSSNHFVNDDSQGPPVDWLAVALILKDLRRQILRSSAESKSPVFDHLCETKVCQFDVAVRSDEDVFWLKIPVDGVFGVQVLENENKLRGIESRVMG